MSNEPQSTKHARGHPRHRHRAAAHASAHALGEAEAPAAIMNHPHVPKGEGVLVTTDAGLADFIDHVRQAKSFTYDSEFIGEMSYFPKLCLIQAATTQRIALIDPLAEMDLAPFWGLLSDGSVEKIVHAGQQDLEPVFRLTGKRAANIFDTQIAAGLIGLSYPTALSKLARELLGVHLGKGFTFTHWDQRPLSAVQLRYAADDVRYLPALRHEIGRQLDGNGHMAAAREESESLCDPALYEFDADADFLKLRGAGGLGGRSLAILRELMRWRDESSRADDLPPRSFLRDEVLIDLARSPISAAKDLGRVRGLPKPVEHGHGEEIVEATRRGLDTPSEQWPAIRAADETPAERFRIDALWSAMQTLCLGQEIDPALVCSRAEMALFFRAATAGKADETHKILRGWRGRAVGNALLDLMAGRTRVEAAWRDGTLKATVRPAE